MSKIIEKIKIRRLIGLFIFVLGVTSVCYAGREPEEWDTLPQVELMKFSKDSIGFMASDNRFFILDKKLKSFRTIDENTFSNLFPESKSKKPSEISIDTGIGSTILLRASNGIEYQTQDASCSEGQDIHHTFSYKGKTVADNVESCHSISSIEIIGDQLWLGTRWDGEYGHYPAAGIIIQSLKSTQLIRKLDANSGLTGNLIRVIRKDPHTKTIWIATERGLNTADYNSKIINTQYFYEDFDNLTGEATVFLSPSSRQSNPLAVIQRKLSVNKPKDFYAAVNQIPQDKLKRFSLYNFHAGIYTSSNAWNIEDSFAPKEMNVLAPFFIESAKSQNDSVRQSAVGMLCMFNDKRVIDFFIDLEKSASPDRWGILVAKDCINKYNKLGLLKKD